MNYRKIYRRFIRSRRKVESKLIESGQYCEHHHIIPKSMGGKDIPKNMLWLTPREHFFAHLCLAKIHSDKEWLAILSMLNMDASHNSKRKTALISKGRWFAIAREKASPVHSKNTKRLHKENEFFRKRIRSKSANKKRSKTMVKYFQTDAGKEHAEKLYRAANSPEALERKRRGWNKYIHSDLSKEFRKRKSEATQRMNSTDEWKATLKRGGEHPRRLHPEKYENCKKYGDENIAKRPEVKAKISNKANERANIKKAYFELSGFTGDRRTVTMNECITWLKNNGYEFLL